MNGIVERGWYWRCADCGEQDAGYISEEAARAALDTYARAECEDRELR